jgi:hypothetical protein
MAMTAEPGLPEGESAEAEVAGSDRAGLSRRMLLWVSLAATALTAWFFFAWLVLDRMMLDAAGEAIGTGLLVLLLISIIGALARGRGVD